MHLLKNDNLLNRSLKAWLPTGICAFLASVVIWQIWKQRQQDETCGWHEKDLRDVFVAGGTAIVTTFGSGISKLGVSAVEQHIHLRYPGILPDKDPQKAPTQPSESSFGRYLPEAK